MTVVDLSCATSTFQPTFRSGMAEVPIMDQLGTTGFFQIDTLRTIPNAKLVAGGLGTLYMDLGGRDYPPLEIGNFTA